MQAITLPQYGSPDVLKFEDIPQPTAADNQVLIKVHAAAVNPLDWHIMRADPFLVRLTMGFFKPNDHRMGADFAGVIEAVGRNVTNVKVGDRVFGETMGAFAEYMTARADNVVKIPDNISFIEAAAIPVVGFTALQGLRDTGKIKAGDKVLVNGASGGVGSMAVQIAKAYGAEVTGVCSTRNLELVRSIGADAVIDYTREKITSNGKQYDLIYDAVGNLSVPTLQQALTPTGRAVVAGLTTMAGMISLVIRGKFVSKENGQWIGIMGEAKPNQADLTFLANWLEAGKIKAIIDRSYPLKETPEAIRYLETKRARGKVIINIVEA